MKDFIKPNIGSIWCYESWGTLKIIKITNILPESIWYIYLDKGKIAVGEGFGFMYNVSWIRLKEEQNLRLVLDFDKELEAL